MGGPAQGRRRRALRAFGAHFAESRLGRGSTQGARRRAARAEGMPASINFEVQHRVLVNIAFLRGAVA